jgi:hypothetical protein
VSRALIGRRAVLIEQALSLATEPVHSTFPLVSRRRSRPRCCPETRKHKLALPSGQQSRSLKALLWRA